MMTRLGWIALLFLVFLGGDRLASALLKQAVDKSNFRYSRLYDNRAQADILFVGNSRGLGFYQPYIEEISGKKSINLSYNGLPTDLAKVILEDYYDRYDAPEVLVFEITMCDRPNPQLISAFTPYLPYSDRLQTFIQDSAYHIAQASRLTHLFRYNSELFQRALYYTNRSDENWLIDRTITADMQASVQDKDYRLDPHFLTELQAIIQLAESKGSRVELVRAPYYPPFAQRVEGFEAFKTAIQTVTGKTVRDYAFSIPETKYFGDYQHINKAGSRVYIDLLQRDGVF